MPEPNFEQQARNMADSFSKEPSPAVWQNVHKALQQPKRKRRFVLWLMPLMLVGGSIAWYTLYLRDNNSFIHQTTTNKTISYKSDTATVSDTRPQANNKQTINKESTAAIITPSAKQNVNELHNQSTIIYKQEITKGENKKIIITNALTPNKQTSEPVKDDNNNPALLPAITNADGAAKDNKSLLQTNLAALPKDSLQMALIQKDADLSATSFVKDSPATNKSLSTPDAAISTTSLLISDSSANLHSPSAIKQKKISKLHWGLMAEAGTATRKSSALSFNNFEKYYASQTAAAPAPADANGALTNLPGSRGIYYTETIKHGAALGIGIALQKKLSRHLDFVADVAYHYQSLKVSGTTYKDSLVLNNLFTNTAGSYKATQAFHFASVFTGINWHFINTKHLQFGISAGADNLLLFKATQQLYNTTSNTNYSAVQLAGNAAFAKNNYYHYQPSLFTGALVNINWNSKQLQLLPFIRSSFRPFNISGNSSNNHLFSSGVKTIFFFK